MITLFGVCLLIVVYIWGSITFYRRKDYAYSVAFFIGALFFICSISFINDDSLKELPKNHKSLPFEVRKELFQIEQKYQIKINYTEN